MSQLIDGYVPRAPQIALAGQIANAITENNNFIAEAPTGIGKTFAYLVPAILSSKKVVVSTGTKNLQDQLFLRDLPLLLKALAQPIKVALLKGRANYVCHYRLEYSLASTYFQSKSQQQAFLKIHQHLTKFETGDRAELSSISEDDEAWAYATSTADNCLAKDCPYFEACFVRKARKKALKADLVVINHHLFFADCTLKEEGFGEILPKADVVIFDEAHQLPASASNFFGTRFSSKQLQRLLTDTVNQVAKQKFDDQTLLGLIEALENANHKCRTLFDVNNGRYSLDKFLSNPKIKQYFENTAEQLKEIISHLEAVAERDIEYDNLLKRFEAMQQFHKQLLIKDASQLMIFWVELFKQTVVISATPVSVAKAFQSILLPSISYIYTSATLSANGEFQYFKNNLGLDGISAKQFESPFQYDLQSMMYLPRGLPDPNDHSYTQQLTNKAVPIIEAFGGRAFFLFTSFKAMHIAEDILEAETEFNLFVQGDMSKTELLQAFCKSDNAVLLGTSSFWEGVDVRGDALSCVIIDKIPFESPFDPVVDARLKQMRKQGLAPFEHDQLPRAIITLKQGLGRLIRDKADQGLLMVGDPRLSGRPYGSAFFKSLPSMPVSRSEQSVLEFIKNIN